MVVLSLFALGSAPHLPLFPVLDELALPDCVYQAPVSVV